MMENEVESLAGPQGHNDLNRTVVGRGSDGGLVTLGGRTVAISRFRVRSTDRSDEVTLSTYDCFHASELLGHGDREMLTKISTRR